jgi:glycosyltransferase involved in cell wall biosynthesis
MMERTDAARAPLPSGASLLVVATVSITIRNFLIPYARHFRELGWRVDAAARDASSDPAIRDAFDHVYELPLSRSILDLGGLWRGERAISRIVESQPDIVHVHTPIAGFVTRLAIRRMPEKRRPAVVYTTHGFHFHQSGFAATNAVFLVAETVAGRWSDRLVVVNDQDYQAARRHRIVAASRLVRMPGIGVDTERYSRSSVGPDDLAHARGQLGLGSDTPVFVVVGELNRNKRTEDAIRALASMRRTDACLVLAGEGREGAHLRTLASRMGLTDRVRFAGFVGDIRPVVGGAVALVLPSKREGLSRSIMEALALEVPVVASTARGNRELVDADSGFIVRTGDIPGLAAAMDWLADHPAEREEMGRQGRRRMVHSYDLGDLMRRHEELYAEMLSLRDGRRGQQVAPPP